MNQDERRQVENWVLSRPLSEVSHPDNLHFLAMLIQDHDHLREKLMTEPDRGERRAKLDTMRPYLGFEAVSADDYEMAELARAHGVQPIYQEQADVAKKRLIMPPSFVHEVPK